jgi:hypothetical protein
MKAYGMKTVEYENDSKKAGDLFSLFDSHKNPAFSSTGTKNALRSYKKTARRDAKLELKDE